MPWPTGTTTLLQYKMVRRKQLAFAVSFELERDNEVSFLDV